MVNSNERWGNLRESEDKGLSLVSKIVGDELKINLKVKI